jgi:hypothetical protein
MMLKRREVWAAKWHALIGLLAVGMIGLPYWPVLFNELGAGGQSFQFPGINAFLFTLSGGDWLSGRLMDYFVGEEWLQGAPLLLRGAFIVTSLIHLFVLGGIVIAIVHLRRAISRGRNWGVDEHLTLIVLLMLVLHFLYMGSRNAIDHPHYYNAIWVAYPFLASLALDRMARIRGGVAVNVTLLGSMILSVALLVVELHRSHGTRFLRYGPTLSDQMEVAQVLFKAGPRPHIICDPVDIADIPERIFTLVDLIGPQPARTESDIVHIRFTSSDPRDGGITAGITNELPRHLRRPVSN